MSWLLDVNMILASRWTTHPDHHAAKEWIDSIDSHAATSPHAAVVRQLEFLVVILVLSNVGLNLGPQK